MRSTALALALTSLATPALADGFTLEQLEDAFATADVVSGPTRVSCTLSGGAEAECFSITVRPEPATYEIGPFCPTDIADGPEDAGRWFVDGKLVDADGDLIQRLAQIYEDDFWQLYDPSTGAVNVTDTEVACRAAARPDVDEAYYNHCVECSMSYLDPEITHTYVIPLEPVRMESNEVVSTASGAGIAVNGVKLEGPAPVDAILGAYTIAAFDDCGGHVNPFEGYHYHAVTECLDDASAATAEDAPVMVGIALDGYPILAHDPDAILDQCGGHSDESMSYHYHAGAEGSNQILGCMTAQAGCVLDDPDAICDASATVRRGPPNGGPRPDAPPREDG